MRDDVRQRYEQMLEALRDSGCRITDPRRAVVQVLAEGHQHLNHTELLERAQQRHAAIGRATVYRTVELMVELGLIHVTYLGDAGQRFVIPIHGHHHHMVCNECGAVTDVEECHFSSALAAISRETGFAIDSHLVELYGLCPACQ